MKRRFDEWFSIQRAKNPGAVVLGVILLMNVLVIVLSAAIISAMSLQGTEKMGFFEAAFCTITMILDAGCIQFVIADIGQSGVAISMVCLVVILLGMITFTGAVIGYVTNYISRIIETADDGTRKLKLHDHMIILNWNTRASEILNDLLYSDGRQTVVVLVNGRKEEIEREIEERLSDTIARENRAIRKYYSGLAFGARQLSIMKDRFRRNIDVLVREGDVFSTKQLQDISLETARSIVILGNDINNTICRFEYKERHDERSKGNSQTIKTLMQVADLTAAANSVDNQRIVVEITDDWTWDLAQKIIKSKQVDGKCEIIPVRVNRVLGQLLSQFSLMPELNMAYRELMSNKGAEFYTREQPREDDVAFAKKYLANHKHAIPLTFMEHRGKSYCFYAAANGLDLDRKSNLGNNGYSVKINPDYWIEPKTVIILGHNSKSRDIMQGFRSFCDEWNRDGESIVRIVIIDDKKRLEMMDYYREYPFVVRTEAADIFDEEKICSTIEEVINANTGDTSILILSDDGALNEDIDANALANLIYVQQIINKKKRLEPDFDPESIDVVVEIIDPKHHDIVNSYSVNNVVISNRYISKMVTQIGEVEALFDFYTDILSYDDEDSTVNDSKEIYIKKVEDFFTEIPAQCTAELLIRAVLEATTDESIPEEKRSPAFVLGYVKPGGNMVIFGGDQSTIPVKLKKGDKLIIFSAH